MKTYAAESGYVYHYYFLGSEESEVELKYVFSISGDRKTWFVNYVTLDFGALRAWEAKNHRELLAGERYAIAKLTLFEAFDSREGPESLRLPVLAGIREIQQSLVRIGADGNP